MKKTLLLSIVALLCLNATTCAYYASRVGSTYKDDLNPELPRESLPDIARVNEHVTLNTILAQPQVKLKGEDRPVKYYRRLSL